MKTNINNLAETYHLGVDVVSKIVEKYGDDSFAVYGACSRLSAYLESIIELFEENECSTVFESLIDQIKHIEWIKRTCSLASVKTLIDEEKKIILSRSTVLGLLLSFSRSNDKKPVDTNFITIMKFLFSEIGIEEVEKQSKKFDVFQSLFLMDYLRLNNRNTQLIFDSFILNSYIRWISEYKLDDKQVRSIYDATKDYESLVNGDSIIDSLFDPGQIAVNDALEDNSTTISSKNKRIILDAFGEGFYRRYYRSFSEHVLSGNIDRIIDVINSDEFIDYPELSSATVLGKASVSQIRAILDISYLKEEKYEKLICPTLFVQKPDKIETNIRICNNYGLSDFSNNKTLILQNSSPELLAKINFLNHYGEPIIIEDKIHPLFKCNTNEKIKTMTKKIADVELSRNELIRMHSSNFIDDSHINNQNNNSINNKK